MKVLIVEDEILAAERLEKLLFQIDSSTEILDHLDSVKSAVKWFENNKEPDILFLDIQLADGLSFEIFEERNVSCPVIFTTAYDKYALKAFKVNSIDYLLKPIAIAELENAINKYQSQNKPPPPINTSALLSFLQQEQSSYKERFVLKVGEHLKSVKTIDVELFCSLDKTTYLFTKEGPKFILDFALDHLEGQLNPASFFRVNRKFIVQLDCIADMVSYSSSRLKINMKEFNSEEIIVARDRVNDFRAWLDR